MKHDPSDAAGIRALWDILHGTAVPERLPAGISMLAVKHNCGAALFSALERGGLRDTADYADWSLLRGFAFFHRARARRFREILRQLAAGAPPQAPWYVWKGAALLMLVPGYEERFEAGDIDIAIRSGALEAWIDYLTGSGAEIFRRTVTASGVQGFQARFPASNDAMHPAIVLDVKGEDRIPPIELAAGVPVPVKERHLELMRQHAYKSAGLPAPKLRMVYDAHLVGADWHEEVFRILFPAAASLATTTSAPPRPLPAAAEGTRRIEGDSCTILIDADGSFTFDGYSVQRSLPHLLAGAARPPAIAHLDLRLDRDAWPYAVEERSDRVVVWVRNPPSPRESKRLIAALVQRAYQSIGLLTVHSTVVARGDRAIALLGPFGSGKTLTSLQMCAAGASLLAGDAALVDAGDSLPTVAGGTREVWLTEALRDRHFPHLTGPNEGDQSGRPPRVDVTADLPWVPLTSAPPALVGIVLVKVAPVEAADSFIEPVPAATAFLDLFRATGYRFDTALSHCGLPLTELEPRAQRQRRLDHCRALSQSIRTIRVGGSIDAAAEAALTLLR